MARDKISEYDATASSNTVVADVNIAEGCPPSGINDAIRQVMAALKRFQTGADGDTISAPVFIGTTASITTANIVNAAVSGTATFNGATIMSSSLSGTTANFSGATTIGGAAVLSSTANIAGATTIGGAAVLSSTLDVTGASTFSTANITGATTIGGAAVLSSTLNVANTATMGVITGATINGDANTLTVDGTDAVGFRNVPVNSQSAAYTLVLADSGKTILHPIADDNARTFTIPANASVAYPVGTAITFVNLINDVTIAITSDTMYLANDGATGSRTLAAYGVATAVKVASTTWVISGNGLT